MSWVDFCRQHYDDSLRGPISRSSSIQPIPQLSSMFPSPDGSRAAEDAVKPLSTPVLLYRRLALIAMSDEEGILRHTGLS